MGAPELITKAGGGLSARALTIDRPEDFGPELVERARRDGVGRFFCGFLPDEIVGWQPGWDLAWEYFVEQWEFVPLRMSEETSASVRDAVVCATDFPVGEEAPETSGIALARAVANARGIRCEVVGTCGASTQELAGKLGAAAVVVNEVSDWSVGFAIDEWAVRTGRIPLRWQNPGYSPLRYALLGLSLVPCSGKRIPRLSDFISTALRPDSEQKPPSKVSAWFDGVERAESWRALYGARAFQLCWSGVTPAKNHDSSRAIAWLDRPSSWIAFAALHELESVPAETRNLLQEIVANWLAIDLPGRTENSATRDWGMARLARLRPGWLEQFGSRVGDNRESRLAVAHCVVRGAEWADAPTQILPLIRVGRWALDEKAAWTLPFRHAVDDSSWWKQLLVPAPEPALVRPDWRPIAVEACWAQIAQGPSGGSDGSGVDKTLLEQPRQWRCYFGTAGPILHIMAALRFGEAGVVRCAWRDIVAGCGRSLPVGFVRLVRKAFGNEDSFLACLRSLARLDGNADHAIVAGVVTTWARVETWKLWQTPQTTVTREELRIAICALRATVKPLSPGPAQLLPILLALAGRGEEAQAAIACVDQRARTVVALTAATALALRGDASMANEIVKQMPADSHDVPVWMFLRALVGQLTGDLQAAAEALARLRVRRPGFFSDRWVSDARWAWAAFLFQRVGRPEAQELVEVALKLHPSAACFLENVETIDSPLANGWETFLRR